MIFPPPLKNVVFVNGLILIIVRLNKWGTIKLLGSGFLPIIGELMVSESMLEDITLQSGYMSQQKEEDDYSIYKSCNFSFIGIWEEL